MTAEGPNPVLRRPGDTAGPAALGKPVVSVLIPAHDEVGNIGVVLDDIAAALRGRIAYEVIVVDDGSADGTSEAVAGLATAHPELRLVCHDRRSGKSAALSSGAWAASADWLVLMDGDGQYDPEDIVRLIAAVEEAAEPLPALVVGVRARRRDRLSRRVASRVANGVRGAVLRDGCPDTGSGLQMVHRRVFLSLPYFNGLHRFLPALTQGIGYQVAGVPIRHRERLSGTSKYTNLGRAFVGIFDLLGTVWLIRRTTRPVARTVALERAVAAAPLQATERNRVGSR